MQELNQVYKEMPEQHLISSGNAKPDIKNNEPVVFSALEVGKCRISKIEPVSQKMSMSELEDIFRHKQNLNYVPVVDKENSILGYIMKERFLAFLGKSQFHRDVYLRPEYTIEPVIDSKAAVLDSRQTLYEASKKLMSRDLDRLYDPFIITHAGQYYGMATVRSVMDGLNAFSTRNMVACSSAQKAILANSEKFYRDRINLHFILEEVDDLGGDFIFHTSLTKNLHFIGAFDVSGKGLKASNMVMTIQSVLKSSFELFMLIPPKKRTSKLVIRLINRLNRLVAQNTPFDMYATGALFLVDTEKMIMDYFDFGHTPVYITRKNKVQSLPIKEQKNFNGIPFFGIDEDLKIHPNRFRIHAGDKLFIHSDGLDESRNKLGEEFGEKRILSILKDNAEQKPKKIIAVMKEELEKFRYSTRVLDDLTILSFQIK